MSELNKEQMLNQLTSTGLTALEYIVKLDSIADKQEVTAYTNSVIQGLKSLEEGEWDDDAVTLLEEDLERLNLASKDPDFHKGYQEGMSTTYDFASRALELLRTKEGMKVEAEERISEHYENLSVLEQQSGDALDIVQNIADVNSAIIENTHASAKQNQSNRIDNIINETNAINRLIKMDYDKDTPGLQIKLGELTTDFAKRAAGELGFSPLAEGVEGPEGTGQPGVTDYFLPEDQRVTLIHIKMRLHG